MDLDTYDQIHVPGRDRRRRARTTCSRAEVTVAMHEGVPLYVELPTQRRAGDHLHRAGPAGRPVDRRHQAGDRWRPAPRSRCRCSSAPARRSRSTPATAATSAGSTADDERAQQGPQAGARRALRSRPAGHRPDRDAGATELALAEPPVNDYTVALVEGVAEHRDRIDEHPGQLRRGLDDRPDAGRRPGHSAARRSTSCCGATTCPTRSPSTRRSSWPSCCPRTSRRASSMAFSLECCATDRPSRELIAPGSAWVYGSPSRISDSGVSTCHRTSCSVKPCSDVS